MVVAQPLEEFVGTDGVAGLGEEFGHFVDGDGVGCGEECLGVVDVGHLRFDL